MILTCGVCNTQIKWRRREAAECDCGKSRVRLDLVDWEDEPEPVTLVDVPAPEPADAALFAADFCLFPVDPDALRCSSPADRTAIHSAPSEEEPVPDTERGAGVFFPEFSLVSSGRTSSSQPNTSKEKKEEAPVPVVERPLRRARRRRREVYVPPVLEVPEDDIPTKPDAVDFKFEVASGGPVQVRFFVQSVPGRPVWEETRANLEASDARDLYEVVSQQEGDDARDTFRRLMCLMALSEATYVVRLEDDLVGVNEHLAHNVRTWPARLDRRFGAGWLFAPGGGGLHPSHHPHGSERWVQEIIHGSLGVVFRRTDVLTILRYCEDWFTANPGDRGVDLAIGFAVLQMGKQIAIHSPSLLEHGTGNSTYGYYTHPINDTSDGRFDQKWRRD